MLPEAHKVVGMRLAAVQGSHRRLALHHGDGVAIVHLDLKFVLQQSAEVALLPGGLVILDIRVSKGVFPGVATASVGLASASSRMRCWSSSLPQLSGAVSPKERR